MSATLQATQSLAHLDPSRLPGHVAIVMDGNRRWARKQGLQSLVGHQRGARATRAVIEACVDIGLPILTLYTFSTENWHRSRLEVRALMRLIEDNLRRELPELHANHVQIRHLGRRSNLPLSLLNQLDEAVELTASNAGLILNLAINYGGRCEIVDAARSLAFKATRGQLNPDLIDEALFERELYTQAVPDPDLLIRTGGEMRISNFLPWQIAYAELVVTPTLWPDFGRDAFLGAIAEYQARERRFGSSNGNS